MANNLRTQWNDDEDNAMQGLSADAQVIYLRAMRRHMDYATRLSTVSYGLAKRVVELIPDPGSRRGERRVADISNDYIRARFDELERAGLVIQQPKKSRYDAPVFLLGKADIGDFRLKSEPQRNPKDGTPKEPQEHGQAKSTASEVYPQNEPQRNPKGGTPRLQVTGNTLSLARALMPIPDDFAVTDTHRDMARIMGAPAPESCVDAFIGNHQSKNTVSANWDAEFRKWLAREREYSRRPTGGKHATREIGNGKLSAAERGVAAEREYLEGLEREEREEVVVNAAPTG